MSDISALDELLEAREKVKSYWGTLADLAPETTEKLRELLNKVSSLENAAKNELREMSKGSHVFGDVKFSVSAGPKKVSFDLEDIMLEAEEHDHIGILLQHGFLTYAVDEKQLTRLPDELQVLYSEFKKESRGTPRVSMPKNLWKA
jgi:hypothetical protein